ncbi:MAG: class I tRNA ligase family protein, partial [Dehalococcoidales bacterium]|nr:class I tRNA ligase family protein [Dehalococcoidales bacterium]
TLGWPEDTADLRYFYPTSVMETGYDILFFWVARMIMMGIEDTGDIPFHTVYLHGLIRDEKGEKMSKVRGNVLDPIVTLEKYGTDALRFAITTGTSPGNDLRLSQDRLEASRNFANKLWNASRFVLGSIPPPAEFGLAWEQSQSSTEARPVEDRWILSRLNRTLSSVTSLMVDFQFGEAQKQIYDFLWGEFCDWYIELAKIRLRSSSKEMASPVPVLVHVLETSLRLLHPYMPFITEELWQNVRKYLPSLPAAVESIMIAPYPEADTAIDPEAEQIMESVVEIVHSIRNARAEYQVASDRWVEARIYAGVLEPVIAPYSAAIQTLARVRPVTLFASRLQERSADNALVLLLKESEVVIPMASMLNLEEERARVQKEMEQGQVEIVRLQARLDDSAFLTKAPAAVVDKERQRLATVRDKLARLRQQLGRLS